MTYVHFRKLILIHLTKIVLMNACGQLYSTAITLDEVHGDCLRNVAHISFTLLIYIVISYCYIAI